MSKVEQIAKYLSRVAEKRDVEKLAWSAAPGLEGVESPEVGKQRQLAADAVKAVKQDRLPSPEQAAATEAIILPKIRPVLDVIDGDFHTEHPLWQKLNTDAAIRKNLKKAILSVGRLELPGNPDYPYGGTGFVVGKGLIMTNRHVAAIFSNGLGSRNLSFRSGLHAGIDFLRELDGPSGDILDVVKIVMIHPYWDMALLKVDGLPEAAEPLKFSLLDAPVEKRIEVAAIGYPAFDTRNDADVQNDLFREVFGVKRLQPGTLGGRENTDSFGKDVPAVRHDCSTLGGNSGSALIDFATGDVVALHFGGRYTKTNWGVPTCELAKDPRVFDAGVNIPGGRSQSDPAWQSWWTDADEFEATDADDDSGNGSVGTASTSSVQSPPKTSQHPKTSVSSSADGSVTLSTTLYITLRLGGPGGAPAISAQSTPSTSPQPESTEKMVSPFHDTRYSTRTGYDPTFLDSDTKIPMPTPSDPGVVAKTKDGESILHYQNFSIVMHAKRRLALFTASNVTAEARLKKPEPNQQYSRKALSGLGPNDQELWFTDPRLDDQYQLPDVFYTKDDGAFDKGHIVRREDVAWGKTYAALRRGNGDSYHLTNCSPQVAGYNRSNMNEGDNWGGLENVVLKGAASERYCQFAGPILDPADQVFVGAGGGGVKLRIKIPSSFWKVLVLKNAEGVAAYGFVLEQDLSDVPLELVVPEKFVKYMEPLADIQKKTGIKFPKIVLNADQYDTTEGVELAFNAGAKRRAAAENVT